jgi:hypothetical protein
MSQTNSILVSKVPRALDLKTRLYGFELVDALLICTYLSISNFFFRGTSLKFPIVWMGTFAVAGFLYFIKRGKPDHFLQHSIEFYKTPTVYGANVTDTVAPACLKHNLKDGE